MSNKRCYIQLIRTLTSLVTVTLTSSDTTIPVADEPVVVIFLSIILEI